MEVKLREARSLVKRLSFAIDSNFASETVAEIRIVSRNDPDLRSALADAGAVQLLAACLHYHSTVSDATKENAAAALLNLSISSREVLMSTPGILDALTSALRSPSAAQHAAATLYSLLSVDAYRPIIGSKKHLVGALVSLLRAPPGSPTRTIKDALKALFGIALYPLNRATLVELGAVPPLFMLVGKDRRTGVVEDATAVIAQVSGCYESVEAFRRVGGVPVLIDLVDAGSGRARENAAAALLNLVMCGGEEAAREVREIEGAEAAVRELAAGGDGVSERGKGKAEALLKALESGRGNQRRHKFEVLETGSSAPMLSSSLGTQGPNC